LACKRAGGGMICREFTDEQIRAELRDVCEEAGGTDAWADLHGWSGRHVRGVLSGERLIPAGFYLALGFERVTVTRRARTA
jgi:hypothetical protein